MTGRILKRVLVLVLVLFGVTLLAFIFSSLSPTDAAYSLAVRRYTYPTPEQVETVRQELGMDKPIWRQYGRWVWNALHGDFGNSYNTGRPIIQELIASAKPTFAMASLALLFSAAITIPLGVTAASRRGGLLDKTIYLYGIIGMSVPNYWMGFMLLLAFAVNIPIFSVLGAGGLKDFILPSLALAIPTAAGSIRIFRSSLLSSYSCDFVSYARARGVPERKIAGLVTRCALPPIVTMFAQSFGFTFAGSAMVESVFSISGVGSMLVTALSARDTVTVNACVLFVAAVFVIVNFMADVICGVINPRTGVRENAYVL